MADTCKCGNELAGSIKREELLNYLWTGQVIKKDSAPWSKYTCKLSTLTKYGLSGLHSSRYELVTFLLIPVIIFFIYLDAMSTFDQNLWRTKWRGSKKSVFFHPSVRVYYFSKALNEFRLILVVSSQCWTEGPLRIPVCLQYTIYDGAEWIYLAYSRGQGSALPQRAENFWILGRWLDSKERALSLETVKLLGENIFLPYWSNTIRTIYSPA